MSDANPSPQAPAIHSPVIIPPALEAELRRHFEAGRARLLVLPPDPSPFVQPSRYQSWSEYITQALEDWYSGAAPVWGAEEDPR